MKCKSCGANYPSREIACPYCDTPNPRGMKWKAQRDFAQWEYQEARSELEPVLRLRRWDKIVNRVLLIEIALIVLMIAGVFVAFFLEEQVGSLGSAFGREGLEQEFAALYEEERFGELYHRLDETGLLGEDFFEYSQMALLHYDYQSFDLARMEFFCELEELEGREPWGTLYDEGDSEDAWLSGSVEGLDEIEALYEADAYLEPYVIERLIWEMNQVLSPYIPAYEELTAKNEAYLAEYQADVMLFGGGILGMTELELEMLSQDYLTMEDEQRLVNLVLARRHWNGL